MRELNSREKNLGVFTVIGCVVIGGWGINSRLDRRLMRAEEEMVVTTDRIAQAKALLVVPEETKQKAEIAKSSVFVPPPRTSLFILNDLTKTAEVENIKIKSTVKTGETGFQIVAEGEFVEMMRFLSFLERQDGKFSVTSATWAKAEGGEKGKTQPNDTSNLRVGNERLDVFLKDFKLVSLFLVLWIPAVCRADHDPDKMSWNAGTKLKEGYRNAPWVRDPFFPDSNKFRVAGIISGEMAFVNGKWVREGDWLEGYLVKRVSHKGVVLAKKAEVVVLKMREQK